MYFKKSLKCVALVGLLIPVAAHAGTAIESRGRGVSTVPPGTAATESKGVSAPVTQRSLEEWLDAHWLGGESGEFFPPFPDYGGWIDTVAFLDCTTFALVDYAGVAGRYLEEKYGILLGTQVTGEVIERKRPDGTAVVTIDTWTINALGFAQSCEALRANEDFVSVDTIFGNKAVDVAADEPPAIGPVKFRARFVIPEAGGALPNLVTVLGDACGFAPLNISFDSLTYGTREDGTQAVMRVKQTGNLSEQQCENGETDPVFGVERIEIKDAPAGLNPSGSVE